MHVSTANELIKFKREKFLTSIRKQKNELVFQQKRWKPLIVEEMAQSQNVKFPWFSLNYLLEGQITSDLLYHLKNTKIFIQDKKNHESVFTAIDQMRKIASFLLSLMEDKERIQSAIVNETIYKAQEILIDLTFFLDSTSTLQLVQLPNFKNIFNCLSCSHYSLQTDCLRLILNILSDLNSQEKTDMLDKYNILVLITDTYLTWGVEQKFIKKALQIIKIIFLTKNQNFEESDIEETLSMINLILQNSTDKKIEFLCYRVINVIIQRANSYSIVKAEIPTLLVHFLAQCTNAEENKVILNQNLATLYVLSEISDWQFQNLINQGLPRSITNVLQLDLADDDLIFAKIIKLCAEIFYQGNYDERTSIIMDDQRDLVDVILTSINQKFKFDCELPNHTARLINNLTNNENYIADVLQSLDFFKIMCVQMERFDCCESNFFSLKDWLNSIYTVFQFGKKLDENDQFVGYFLKYNGDKITETLQRTENIEIYQLCQKIMNFIE